MVLSSGCQAPQDISKSEVREKRGKRLSLSYREEPGDGLCVDNMRLPLRFGNHLDARYPYSETRRIGDRQYPQVKSIKAAWQPAAATQGDGEFG